MHIAVLNNIYPPIMAGGAELIVAYLCEGLVEMGHRVTVISTCGPEMEPYPVEIRKGVEIIRFFPKNRYWSFGRAQEGRPTGILAKVDTARWHLRDAWNRDAGRRVAGIFAGHRPDLLHTHLVDGFSASIWAQAKRRGLPVIHTAHDYHLLCPRAFMLSRSWKICMHPTVVCRTYRKWHLHTTSDIDLFVSPSDFLLNQHKQAGLRSRESAIVRYGIPLPGFQKLKRDGVRNRFLLLTRLTPEKGIRNVLNAMLRMPDADLELTIAGRGPLENEVRAAAAADKRIRFLGYVQGDAKHEALVYADHLLIPSEWYENAPVVILEAAAYELSLVASRMGAMPEFVRPGRTGRLFEPGDPASLADAMLAAVVDDKLLDGLAVQGPSLVSDHTVPRMLDTYLGHYTRLLQQ